MLVYLIDEIEVITPAAWCLRLFRAAGRIDGNIGRAGLPAVDHRRARRPRAAADRVVIADAIRASGRSAGGGRAAGLVSGCVASGVGIKAVGARRIAGRVGAG